MSYCLRILFIISLFVAASANNVWACGSSTTTKCGQTSSKKSCCTNKKVQSVAHCNEQADACGQKHAGQKCPGGSDNDGCHCPCSSATSGHAGVAIAELPTPLLLLSSSDATLRQAFYFAQYMPEAVYLAIWQPPQLGV